MKLINQFVVDSLTIVCVISLNYVVDANNNKFGGKSARNLNLRPKCSNDGLLLVN